MTKRKIEIKLIEDKARRHTTFSKRRKGLNKKSQSFADKFDAEVAVISFSQAGNAYAYGHHSVESVVRRYLDQTPETSGSRGAGSAEEKPTEGETKNRIRQALDGGDWESAVEGLELPEIDELSSEIAKMKRAVAARAEEILERGESSKTGEGDVSRQGSSVESVIGGNRGES